MNVMACSPNHLGIEMTNAPRDCSPKRVLTSPTYSEVVMAKVHICAVNDCGKPVVARGWCRVLAGQMTRDELAQKFGVSSWAISDVLRGNRWGWLE